MYLPLAGHNDLNREETFRVPLGSKTNLQNVLPANNAHKARNQKQEQHHSKEKSNPEEEKSLLDQKKDVVDRFYSSSSMSTQDFVALSNFASDNSFACFSKKNYF